MGGGGGGARALFSRPRAKKGSCSPNPLREFARILPKLVALAFFGGGGGGGGTPPANVSYAYE